ncbi:MAG TPA: Tol-Pal system beta propeller repeat protein TolB [Fredinandcohnia sp.]|nr:Tol-Pal system beta propeller repeat protein TolB [Fredinandcohnia sp.]
MRGVIVLRSILGLVLVWGLALPVPASAQETLIEVSGATFRPLPIAVAPPIAAGDAAAPAEEIHEALSFDLEVSGLFEVIPRKAFLADPREPLGPEGIVWTRWSDVAAEALLKFEVTSGPQGLSLAYRLYDVATQRQTGSGTLEGRIADARRLAHRLADELVRHFTQEPGAFSTRIAYVRRPAGGAKEIWIADFDGKNASPVTQTRGISLLPTWSPSGNEIAYTFFKKSLQYPHGHPQVWKANLLTGKTSVLVSGGDLNTGAAWSPDGTKIAFTMSRDGNPDIYVVNADGSGLRRLTREPSTEASPCWSPDGKRIAFVSDRHGTPQIFVMDADGGNVERITRQGNYNQTPAWSPRGDEIAFTARDERYAFDLFVVNVETKEIRRLTQDQGNNQHPTWAPNGRLILFTSDRDGGKALYVGSADGRVQRRISPRDGAEYTDPAWGPFPIAVEEKR